MVSEGQVEGHVRHLWPGVAAYSELYAAEIMLENLRLGQSCLHQEQTPVCHHLENGKTRGKGDPENMKL